MLEIWYHDRIHRPSTQALVGSYVQVNSRNLDKIIYVYIYTPLAVFTIVNGIGSLPTSYMRRSDINPTAQAQRQQGITISWPL